MSLCAPAGVAAHQRLIWLRFRGPGALALAVSSTSAPAVKSLSTAQPPVEQFSPDPNSPTPSRPRPFQGALVANGASDACDAGLFGLYSLTLLSEGDGVSAAVAFPEAQPETLDSF